MDTKHLPENIVDDRGTLACCDAGLPAARRQLAHVEPEHLRALDRISIEGLEVFANHGVFPEENALGQKFVVSVTFYTDTRRAGETDDLAGLDSLRRGGSCRRFVHARAYVQAHRGGR